MGAIYASAYLTVITASGEDPTYGLPTISRSFDAGGTFSGSYLFPETTVVHTSKWATRAWTFQESLQSRRRLFFTDHGLIFHCSVDTASSKRKGNVLLLQDLALSEFTCHRYKTPMIDMMCILEQYVSRDLSFDSDALNAIVGVLRTFAAQAAQNPGGTVYHMWAVAFQFSSESELLVALNWYSTADLRSHTARRRGFPSWSPLGWSCKDIAFEDSKDQFKSWNCASNLTRTTKTPPVIKLWDGNDTRLIDPQRFDVSAFATQCLQITAKSVRLSQTYLGSSYHGKYDFLHRYYFFVSHEGKVLSFRPSWDDKTRTHDIFKVFTCLFTTWPYLVHGLILEEHGAVFERVGYLTRSNIPRKLQRDASKIIMHDDIKVRSCLIC